MVLKVLWIICFIICFMLQVESARICPVNARFYNAKCICHLHMVKFEIDGFLICQPCTQCDPGYIPSHKCNNFVSYKAYQKSICKKCPDDHFTFHNRCLKCENKCHLKINEIEIRSCNGSNNRMCQCKKEYYRDIGSHECTSRCSRCPSYEPEKRVPAGECLDMSPDMRCLDDDTTSKITTPKPAKRTTPKPTFDATTKHTKTTPQPTTTEPMSEATTETTTKHTETTTKNTTTEATTETTTKHTETTTKNTTTEATTKTTTKHTETTPKNATPEATTENSPGLRDIIIYVFAFVFLVITVILVYMKYFRRTIMEHGNVASWSSESTTESLIKDDEAPLNTIIEGGDKNKENKENATLLNSGQPNSDSQSQSETIMLADRITTGPHQSPKYDIDLVCKNLEPTGYLDQSIYDNLQAKDRLTVVSVFANHPQALQILQSFCLLVFHDPKYEVDEFIYLISDLGHIFKHIHTKHLNITVRQFIEHLLDENVDRQDVVKKLIEIFKKYPILEVRSLSD